MSKINVFIVLTLAGLLNSCQYENEVVGKNNLQPSKYKIEKRNFDELMKVPHFKTAFGKIPKQKAESSLAGKTVMEHNYGFNISNTPAVVLSVGNKLTSYTFHITRETPLPINQIENLVVQVDSTGTTNAYITKYFLNAEPIYNTTDREYCFNINHTELSTIVYNNAEHIINKIAYTGADGCTIITLMCDYGVDHAAGPVCLDNGANRNFYLSSDSSACQSGSSPSVSTNSNSGPSATPRWRYS